MFTPANEGSFLNANDQDVGSTGPAILPPVRANGKTYHLMVQGGKGPAGTVDFRSSGLVPHQSRQTSAASMPGALGEPTNNPTLLGQRKAPHGSGRLEGSGGPRPGYLCQRTGYNGVRGCYLGRRAPQLAVKWDVHSRTSTAVNFTTPVISRGTLYVARNGEIDAYQPDTGTELWSSKNLSPVGQISPTLHWEYPTVTGNMLFMTNESAKVYAYKRT